jgi:hypothetical protein
MFSCSLVRTRAFPRALLLSVSLLFTLDAAADSGDYRARVGTLPGGLRVAEQVDAVTFPQFQGTRPASSSPDAPAVGAGHVRAIRVLLPNNGQNFALALPDRSAYVSFYFYNHDLRVEYGGTSATASVPPFPGLDPDKAWSAHESKWTQYIDMPKKITRKITHFLVTLYVVPYLGEQVRAQGAANLMATVEEATVHNMHVVRGPMLAGDIPVMVSEEAWSRWREKPIRAGMLPDRRGRLALPDDFTSRLPFVEQRTIALHDDPNEHRRDKRCLTDVAYHLTNLHTALLEVYFSRPDLCAFDPHPNQDIAAPLPFVEVIDPIDRPSGIEPTVFEAVALEPSQLQAPHAFDAAMNVQFCNSNHPEGAGDGACTDEDYRAAAALGELTPDRINTLLRQLALMHAADEPGPARLRSGKDDLDRWLNADLARAENALNAAQAVVHVSDARAEPTEPVKKKKKSRLLKASCVEPTPDTGASDDGFQQCVRDAKRKLREPEAVIAVTPAVHTNGDGNRFHLRGTPQFDRLVREFRNTGRGMPGGVAGDQFGGMTAAIARDGAPAGDNLGFIFINDPALRGGAARFPFGVEHIWAPGGGGGDNAGHRDDWTGLRGLPVNSRQMLIQVIMTALTDPNAQYEQRRTNNGNTIRTFRYFVFVHNNTLYAIRNIRIVLGKNGMVVTAYPVANAGAQPLAM